MRCRNAVLTFARAVRHALPVLFILCHVPSQAASVTLAWDRSPGTNLANYRLKYGGASGVYTGQVIIATNLTVGTVSNLVAGQTYYFVVTARNVQGLESDPS